ncbi:Predicted Zn-dependent peptidase [Geodermatophilus dictyosporus]|uniref:Predicted Zn-dependent peptidase n=1 Tax=Geodermatophilus dictyosporus TaxID=1523247 RepID=A0A1I5KTI5_9ACTN|nr:insulinase family protein [Geodermatophilus dictyosporus]SFO88404.1 Predicted Zn-dependent peptidase [Geodermatophilus dictyosporus]
MRQLTVDGIPVFVADGPPPLAAGLVFGVGRRDETFVRGGITHLVEHLAMGALGRTTVETNASVDLAVTEFTATGAPERVARVLETVCTALADLPTDRLAVDADVLRSERGLAAAPDTAVLLGELYGASGPGLASMREPALRAVTADQVRAWARRWFVAGNAALWLVGPVPAELSLPLPGGPVPERAPQLRRDLPTPAWTELPVDERVAVAAELPRGPADAATAGILRARVEEELRSRRGVAYAVELDQVPVDAGRRVVVLSSDARPGEEAVVARLLWREVQRLADEGPQPAELDHERALVAEYLADPRSDADEARATARGLVTGSPVTTGAELREEAERLDAEQVRAVAAALRDAAVLGVAAGTEAPAGLPRLPQWSADRVTGRVFRRARRSGAPRGAELVVGPEGAGVDLGEGRLLTVRWADVIGLVRSPGEEWTLVGRDGTGVPLVAADWRDGTEAVELVRAAVPSELQVTDDEVHDQDGVLLLRVPVHRVREAVGTSRDAVSLVGDGEWTLVAPDGARSAEARALHLGAAGPRTTALVLRRSHADLEYVLYRGGREVDRHRWGVSPGDPDLLARATGRPVHAVAGVLADTGAPEAVLARFAALLGLAGRPAGVLPDLLAGRAVEGLERVEGRGAVQGLRAAVRGDFAPPPGTGGALERYARLGRTRPAWYRAVNAVTGLVLALVAWVLLADGRVALGVLAALLAVCSLAEVRPPRRDAGPPGSPPAAVTPTG